MLRLDTIQIMQAEEEWMPASLEEAVDKVRPFLAHGRDLVEEDANGGDPMQPVVFIFLDKGLVLAACDFGDEQDKNATAQQIRALTSSLAYKGGPRIWGVLLLCDARTWVIPPEVGNELKDGIITYEQAKAQAQMVEAIFGNLETYFGEAMLTFKYERKPDNGGLTWLEPEEHMEGRSEGRFTNMLPPPVDVKAQA